MSIYLKRIALCLAVVAFVVALRLYGSGLTRISCEGEYSVVTASGEATYFSGAPVLTPRADFVRFDTVGDESVAARLLADLGASVKKRESFDGITVFYAYSPFVSGYESLSFGRVNIMIALSNGRVVLGSPLIRGSF